MRDYANFIKSAQPIIDEKALIPTEFNLIEGMYIQSSVNLCTFKKTRVFTGKMFPRDYAYLDVTNIQLTFYIQMTLLNLDFKVRK